MKFIQFFFVVTLCTTIGCSDPKVETDIPLDTSTTSNTIAETLVKSNVETKINESKSNTDKKGNEAIDTDSKIEPAKDGKEEVKEEPKVEEKSEAYKKASEERRRKRRAAREEKKKKEQAAKENNEKLDKVTASSTVKEKIEEKKDYKDLGVKIDASGSGSPKVDFRETEHNFGVIKQGDKIHHDFVFENTGSGDLEIINVNVSCGCTTPSFPFLPIAPGEKGTIGVTYNSTGKLGNQKPLITVITNAKPHTYKIYLKGVVDADRAKPESSSSIDNN